MYNVLKYTIHLILQFFGLQIYNQIDILNFRLLDLFLKQG